MCRSCRYDKCIVLGMEYEFPSDNSLSKDTEKDSDVAHTMKTSLLDRMEVEYK